MNTPEQKIPTEAEIKKDIETLQERVNKLNTDIEEGLVQQKDIARETEQLEKDGEEIDTNIQNAEGVAGRKLAEATQELDIELEKIEKASE